MYASIQKVAKNRRGWLFAFLLFSLVVNGLSLVFGMLTLSDAFYLRNWIFALISGLTVVVHLILWGLAYYWGRGVEQYAGSTYYYPKVALIWLIVTGYQIGIAVEHGNFDPSGSDAVDSPLRFHHTLAVAMLSVVAFFL